MIAIIAILAAILFPVFAQAKAAAKKTAALSDAKQLGLAVVMYSNDFDDQSPISIGSNWLNPDGSLNPTRGQMPFAGGYSNSPAGGGSCGADADPAAANACKLGWNDPDAYSNWAAQLYPYVKSLGLFTSSISQDTSGEGSYDNNPNAGNTSFVYNGGALNITLTSASAPTDLITVYGRIQTTREADVQPAAFDYTFNWFLPSNAPVTGIGANGADIDWAGGTWTDGDNYSFSDGHSKYMKRVAITFRNFGFYGQIGCVGPTCAFSDAYTAASTHMTDPTLAQDNWAAFGLFDVTQM